MVASMDTAPTQPQLQHHEGRIDGEFGYSQKLFHIANGKVYSVFSPLQGRSYGNRPTFYHKRRGGSRQRGRRKGLKFHNFLPAEKSGGGETSDHWWPTERCLREEHGTKQILVSTWSLPPDSNKQDITEISNPSEILSSLLPPSPSTEDRSLIENQDVKINTLSETSTNPANSECISSSNINQQCQPKIEENNHIHRKHRRKPLQINRIVPYKEYLSLVAEDEPLDLSSKSSNKPLVSCAPSLKSESSCSDSANDQINHLVKDELYETLLNTQKDIFKELPPMPPLQLFPSLRNSASYSHESLTRNYNSSLKEKRQDKLAQATSSLQDSMPNLNLLLQQQNTSPPSSLLNKELQPPSPLMTSFKLPWARGCSSAANSGSRRTAVRKRLEDTFRDNGFLVKTKQVSDGDATFCKFRQLRKYTRYYLKSWQHHLPDEVNKIWKGFLPPKSALPSPSSTPSTSST